MAAIPSGPVAGSRVLGDYPFDRELRWLLLDAIERIEMSLRGHFA